MSQVGRALIPFSGARARRRVVRRPARARTFRLFDLDGIFAFVLFAGSLLIVTLGSYGALLFSLAAIGFALLRPRAVVSAVKQHWVFLLFPCYALLSTIWSDALPHTAKHSVEYVMTAMAGIFIASSRNPRAMMLGLFAAFALHTIASLATGTVVAVGDTGVAAVSGLNDSKNQQGDAVANGFLVSALVFVSAWQGRNIFLCLAATAVGLVQLYATIAADSAGAMAGLAFAMVVFATALGLRRAGRQMRAAVMGFAGVTIASAGLFVLAFTNDILSWLSIAFGKDVTLTGRTYLWARAHELLLERPVIGRGFGAFWQQGNVDAEGIWRFAHIANRGGFNFHNTAYDVLVDLGWIGFALFLMTLVFGFWAVASGYIRKPTLFSCYWLAMGAFVLVRMPIETMGIYEFYFSTVLLYAAFAASRAARLPIRPARRPARPRYVFVDAAVQGAP